MKTFEEKTQRVMQRVAEETVLLEKRRKKIRRVAAPALSLCLLAVIGLGAWKGGAFDRKPQTAFSAGPEMDEAGVPIPMPDGTIQREPMPEVFPSHPILRPGDAGYVAPIPTINPDAPSHTEDAPAVPDAEVQLPAEPIPEPVISGDSAQKGGGPEISSGFCEFWWKNKLIMTGDLYWAIDADPDGTFSVLAVYRPQPSELAAFTYEGKTLLEWGIEADNERILPEKMQQLLKQGDELKYGAALCETGTPDGIRWDRAFYEERVAWFGALLDKDIVDGEFLRAELEADIAALENVSVTGPDGVTTVNYIGEDSARKQYALAYQAYLEAALPAAAAQLSANGIPCTRAAYRYDALAFTATAAELENLPLEALGSWRFSLNSGELKSAADAVVTAADEFQTVN